MKGFIVFGIEKRSCIYLKMVGDDFVEDKDVFDVLELEVKEFDKVGCV